MSWLGDRLKTLLKEKRLSIQKVATDLEMERTYLSLITHGRRIPAEDVVRKLAKYFEEDPEEWAFEAKGKPIIEELRERYPNQWPKYARTFQTSSKKEPPPYGLAASPYREFFTAKPPPSLHPKEFIPLDTIEQYAAEVLKVYVQRLGNEPEFPLDAELLVREVFNLDVHYDDDGLLDSMHPSLLGCLFPDGTPCPELAMDRMIVVNCAPRYKYVTPSFTILHEAGHYLFHYPKDAVAPTQQPSYCRAQHIATQKKLKVPPREWQASRLASEVLMPKAKVMWLLDGKPPGEVINLAIYGAIFREFFGVSQAAMEKRLYDLGYQCGFGRYAYANITQTAAQKHFK